MLPPLPLRLLPPPLLLLLLLMLMLLMLLLLLLLLRRLKPPLRQLLCRRLCHWPVPLPRRGRPLPPACLQMGLPRPPPS